MDTAEVGLATTQRAFGGGDGVKCLTVCLRLDDQTPRGGLMATGGDRCSE